MNRTVDRSVEYPLPDFVRSLSSPRKPSWLERFKEGVKEIINFPNPPRVMPSERED